MEQNRQFSHRIAGVDDIPAIKELMGLAIAENMKAYLTAAEIEAARETMGVDQTLIDDGSYFLIETMHEGRPLLVGCGGWGKRRTLYGGDHTPGRDDTPPRIESPAIHCISILSSPPGSPEEYCHSRLCLSRKQG